MVIKLQSFASQKKNYWKFSDIVEHLEVWYERS